MHSEKISQKQSDIRSGRSLAKWLEREPNILGLVSRDQILESSQTLLHVLKRESVQLGKTTQR